MKLRTFNKTCRNCQTGKRTSIPALRITSKGGFYFSSGAIAMFKLNSDDRLLLHQDLECRSSWYLEITKDIDGFKPRLYKNAQSGFVNIATACEIYKSLGKKPQTIKFLIKEKPYIFGEHILYSIIAVDKRKK